MRCNNCGWNNPQGNAKCEKCNVPLRGSMIRTSSYEVEPIVIRNTVLKSDDDEAAERKLVGFLVTYSHSINGRFYPLYEGKNYVGRSSSMSVHIRKDPKVSDKHLSILYRAADRKFKFKDEQSTNGTFINGTLIDEGELKNSDEITIGTTKLVFIEIPGN